MAASIYLAAKPDSAGPQLRLAELIGALSHALDMTEGQPPGHCVRCCWIGMHVGRALGLDSRIMPDLYYTLLLKDLGCSSNAARICALYLADDIRFKRDFKTIDGSLSAALRFVFAQTGLDSGLSERIRAIVNILQNGGEISRELIETRCIRGAEIAAKMRFSTRVQDGIRNLDEHWNGSGKPLGLKGDAIPPLAAIALLAQVVDIFHAEQGQYAAIAEAYARAGTWFSPTLVAAFLEAQAEPDFWDVLAGDTVEARVLDLDPGNGGAPVDEAYLDEIAIGLRRCGRCQELLHRRPFAPCDPLRRRHCRGTRFRRRPPPVAAPRRPPARHRQARRQQPDSRQARQAGRR